MTSVGLGGPQDLGKGSRAKILETKAWMGAWKSFYLSDVKGVSLFPALQTISKMTAEEVARPYQDWELPVGHTHKTQSAKRSDQGLSTETLAGWILINHLHVHSDAWVFCVNWVSARRYQSTPSEMLNRCQIVKSDIWAMADLTRRPPEWIGFPVCSVGRSHSGRTWFTPDLYG